MIVGWSESDKRRGFRSLLLGVHEGGKLRYAGKVGTGFNARLIEELMERMAPLETDKAAVEVPRADRKGAHWIRPQLVAEIAFTEVTDDGILRHPSFIGLREDKPAAEVVRKVPGTSKIRERGRAADGRKPRDQDQQSRPDHLSRGRADQGRPRRLLRRGRAADHGRRARPADDAHPLPAGPGQEMLLPEA